MADGGPLQAPAEKVSNVPDVLHYCCLLLTTLSDGLWLQGSIVVVLAAIQVSWG